MKTWLKSAAAGFWCGGALAFSLGMFLFRWDRDSDIQRERDRLTAEFAAGASRETVIGFMTACRARGGTVQTREYASPPTLVCMVFSEVRP